jgi:hypothetical protein
MLQGSRKQCVPSSYISSDTGYISLKEMFMSDNASIVLYFHFSSSFSPKKINIITL